MKTLDSRITYLTDGKGCRISIELLEKGSEDLHDLLVSDARLKKGEFVPFK
jgi:hypothetical protein